MAIDPDDCRRNEAGAREDQNETGSGPPGPSAPSRRGRLRFREIRRSLDRLRSSDQPITGLANCFDDSGARGIVVENSSKLADGSSENVLGDEVPLPHVLKEALFRHDLAWPLGKS
jgi:hypothetical protein